MITIRTKDLRDHDLFWHSIMAYDPN